MKLVTGKVIGGKIEFEGDPLDEGSIVTVLARENDETFELSPAEVAELLLAIEEANRHRRSCRTTWPSLAELLLAIEEANRGDFVDCDEFLRSPPLR